MTEKVCKDGLRYHRKNEKEYIKKIKELEEEIKKNTGYLNFCRESIEMFENKLMELKQCKN
jgi:hypothetical protein